ncbi:MAG: hypothetical protein HYS81_02800 [Candidatus Aenigmatarchaeota archaeon]|nr:MAG: hypothetical protein HYS81_02800 [Candidatus Aenigmarchaeota archaeon]
MPPYVTAAFAILLGFEILAAYATAATALRAGGVYGRSLQSILAAVLFLACATAVRLGFYTGILPRADALAVESCFYTFAFLNFLPATLMWRGLGRERVSSISANIKEFYGEIT